MDSHTEQLKRIAPKLRCLLCGSPVVSVLVANTVKLECTAHAHPWCSLDLQKSESERQLENEAQANQRFIEGIFDYPAIYRQKSKILSRLNGFREGYLNPIIEGQEILDLGCGSYQYYFNPAEARLRVGMDVSSGAIRGASCLYPDSLHVVGSIVSPLPFQDRSFDVALLLFVIHHLPIHLVMQVLKESIRTAKKYVVVLDHTRSDSLVKRMIQTAYWKVVDGGTLYRSEHEWTQLWKDMNVPVLEYKRHGAMFKNICYYKLDVSRSDEG